MFQAKLNPNSTLMLKVYRNNELWSKTKNGLPQFGLSSEINRWRTRNLFNLFKGIWKILIARLLKIPHFYGAVSLTIVRKNGERVFLGTAGFKVVTNNGVAFIVDAFQNLTELENLEFHGLGTDNTAEAAADSALGTELTTEYNPNNTRATGTNAEGASANIYRTVGTNTLDGAAAIVEHGIFDQAATGGGTLLDRTVFSVINLGSGDGLQSTYELTFTAGS